MDFRRIAAAVLLSLAGVLPCAAERAPDPDALAAAVESGDINLVERLLSRGADPRAADARGRTPLYCAAAAGNLVMVERLLETPADPDAAGPDGLTPLMLSVLRSRDDLALILLLGGADPNVISDYADVDGARRAVSALSLAVDRGEFVVAEKLVENGADGLLLANPETDAPDPLDLPSTRVPLDARIWRDRASLADNASSPDWRGEAWTLHRAARSGDWRSVRDTLNAGADPDLRDQRGVTALMAAAWHGREAVVSLLLRRGADPGAADAAGRSGLCYAAAAGNANIVGLIASALETVPTEQAAAGLTSTPEYWALIGGHFAVLENLLKSGGAAISAGEAADTEGVALLMIAAWLGDLRAVRLLLPLTDGVWDGGPPGEAAMDPAGRTALEWSLAAFERDRRVGREIGRPDRGSRNYPVARLLARRGKNPSEYRTVPTADTEEDVIEAWSVGMNPRAADDWRLMSPAPVPERPGDGDLTLYRILRDEEPGTPTGS